MHVYSGMGTQCTVYASTKDQSNGTQRSNIQGQSLHTKDQSYGPMGTQCMYNPIGTQGTCVCKGPTLWGSDAQIEDQSYEHTVSQSYGMLHVATHTYVCTYVHVRVLCHVGRTIYMGNPASLHKEELL